MQYRLTTYAEDTWDVYWFERNLQGDIVAVYNTTGTKLISYTYDAWGNFTSTYYNNGASTTAVKNPFRYRGYYYDSDLQLYYLQTRYYDSVTGRFISPDDISYLGANGDLNSFNLYAYCSNNPVNYLDPTGNSALAITLFILGSALIGGIAGAFTAVANNDDIIEGTVEGALLGTIAATSTIVAPLIVPEAAVTITTFASAAIMGAATDFAIQAVSHNLSSDKEQEFQLDTARLVKTGISTGIGGIMVTCGNPASSITESVGSLIIGFDASFINSIFDVIFSNIFG